MYNKDVTISELEHEIKKLKDDLEKQTSARKSEESARQFYVDQVTKLKADREVLVKALKKYATADNYSLTTHSRPRIKIAQRMMTTDDCEEIGSCIFPVAGKIARQALKSIGEIE
jgi:phage host-nuclease inhibitor protein Gam